MQRHRKDRTTRYPTQGGATAYTRTRKLILTIPEHWEYFGEVWAEHYFKGCKVAKNMLNWLDEELKERYKCGDPLDAAQLMHDYIAAFFTEEGLTERGITENQWGALYKYISGQAIQKYMATLSKRITSRYTKVYGHVIEKYSISNMLTDNMLTEEEEKDISAATPPSTHAPSTKSRKRKSREERISEAAVTPYLLLAKQLSTIIQTKKNIRHPPSQVRSWCKDIKRLVKTNRVASKRVGKALDWYSNHIGEPYIPVIESGRSLRQKFLKLEEARSRAQSYDKKHPYGSAVPLGLSSPKKVIRKAFQGKDESLRKRFRRECYKPALTLLARCCGTEDKKAELAHCLCSMYTYILKRQARITDSSVFRLVPGPIQLIKEYTEWIKQNSWIKSRAPGLYRFDNAFFRTYLREQAGRTDGRNPITGKRSH